MFYFFQVSRKHKDVETCALFLESFELGLQLCFQSSNELKEITESLVCVLYSEDDREVLIILETCRFEHVGKLVSIVDERLR